ncbi:MAG: 3-phosphoshikimate 1-carboxyvinyltransferase [Fimbriimonadaceae bacterium]|nr:3-phosphoshikimate 1-carboxyvinyltransferase [Alphaproteobacteria bacterium]
MSQTAKPLKSSACTALSGMVTVPGDKSISHRALIFGALAVGETIILGLLESHDVLATAKAVTALGAQVARRDDGSYHVAGTGAGAMLDPEQALDLGNAGTGVRLLMGLIAGQGLTATFTGDASLQSRPMARILDPLQMMGARIVKSAPGCRLPLTLKGSAPAIPIDYRLPVASAQVKSAVLIAGLGAIGHTIVREPKPTRDHTERMLRHFGADISVTEDSGERIIRLQGDASLTGGNLVVPGDPSSAAFPIVAGTIVPGSDILIRNVMINPTRDGLFVTLREMGADLVFENEREVSGEPVADIRVRYRTLKGVDVPASRAPLMIDEYPVLAIAAAFAEGPTIMRGLAELRVKESDRLTAIVDGLTANGVIARIADDNLIVEGRASKVSGSVPGNVPGGGLVETHLDHRIAMSFLVMGMATDKPVVVDDSLMIATSFPEFARLMASLGAVFAED